MYSIIPVKKSNNQSGFDYMFKKFDDFYKIADVITVPLQGKYNIAITTEDVDAVMDFIKIENKYDSMNISIFMSQALIDFISMRNGHVRIKEQIKPYDEYMKKVAEKSILFEKGVALTLYSAIEHDSESIDKALDEVLNEYGARVLITEKMISKLFLIEKIVYPRTVLIDYLWMRKYRDFKLRRSIETCGAEVVLHAMIKNVKKLMEEKAKYFKTGNGSNLIKSIDTKRLHLMYRILYLERGGIQDIEILMHLYERGLSSYDYLQEEYE